jgi:mono/diheme cytochrome c family protein
MNYAKLRSATILAALVAAALAILDPSSIPTAHAQAPKARVPSATRIPAQTDGEYLARAGDCIACHTARGGEPFAGGLEMLTPFGSLYTPNITPDPETGIGKWSADDFYRALHEGKSKDGSLLYPAFPYPSYTKVTRADSDAIYGYIMSIAPVKRKSTPHKMQFPYNQRNLMIGWRTLYFTAGEYKPDPSQSAEWNRGAYLVLGLGHCDACHTSRNMLGATVKDKELSGGLIPLQDWYAPSLTSNREAGLGQWEVEEVVALLRTGISKRGVVFGPMAQVVHDSLQYITEADTQAMAVYLEVARDRRCAGRSDPGQADRHAEPRGVRGRRQDLRPELQVVPRQQRAGRAADVSAARQQPGDQHGVLGQPDPHGALRRLPAVDARQPEAVRHAAVRLHADRPAGRRSRDLHAPVVGQPRERGERGRSRQIPDGPGRLTKFRRCRGGGGRVTSAP